MYVIAIVFNCTMYMHKLYTSLFNVSRDFKKIYIHVNSFINCRVIIGLMEMDDIVNVKIESNSFFLLETKMELNLNDWNGNLKCKGIKHKSKAALNF